jgi:hypothetical protein
MITSYIHVSEELNTQFFLQFSFLKTYYYFAVDFYDWDSHLVGFTNHFLPGCLIRGNVYVLKGETILLEELYRPLAVWSGR